MLISSDRHKFLIISHARPLESKMKTKDHKYV